MLNTIQKIRTDFPILSRSVRNGKPLIYLDNAATTQKPQVVINALTDYYTNTNANVHRGIHYLSEVASEQYEHAHQLVSDFIGAEFSEVIFTKNSTEGLNIVARSLEGQLQSGDEIVLTRMEHHSNLVPFQQLAAKTGAVIRFIELSNLNELDDAAQVISDHTKIVSMPHMSNVLGTINPVKEIGKIAHEHDALMLVDGAQSVPHLSINVKDLNADFLAFSGHKMLAPMGIGSLYGKEEYLNEFDPLLFGGDMIRSVSYADATWNDLPWKFEAGTPNVGGGIGFGAAVEYLNNIGMQTVQKIEHELTKYAMQLLEEMPGVTIFGPTDPAKRGAVISFNLSTADGLFIHPHDVASYFDEQGIAIRAGHHCAQPLMGELHVPATSRMSFYIYNTFEEIDAAITAIHGVQEIFG